MSGITNRFVGGILATMGVLLSAFHLANIVGLRSMPAQVLVEGSPLVLSIAAVAVGVLLGRDRLIPNQFAGRMLAWVCAGVLALSVLGVWHFAIVVTVGFPLSNALVPMLNVATFGALVGSLVGVYDVRRLESQQSIERLHRINDTIRIATQELVNRTERDELEQAVCDRLNESEPYDSIWIGRYDADDARVRPAAWAGFDDDYVESIVVTVDDSPTGTGAGGRAIKTREIQCVPDVFADPTMEPWWDLFESRNIQSLAVVPIVDGETVYGFFSVYADRQNVFDEREREVLAELGTTIGHAIASIEARERLAEHERELQRQNERLDAFAGVVSHDLRNPLNVAQGNLERVRETGDDESVARIDDALTRMDDLIHELLTLARQGAMVDDTVRVPLRDVVDHAWSTARTSEAALRIEGDLGVVSCDRSRLRQLLENLFRNSVEHGSTNPRSHAPEDCVEHGSTSSRPPADDTVEHGSTSSQGGSRPDDSAEHGSSNVTVTVRSSGDGFVVEDDGPGIPAGEREAVFEAGYTTNDGGTGLGLNIVRSIADAHGWTVAVDESPDGGARFEFSGVDLEQRDASAPDP